MNRAFLAAIAGALLQVHGLAAQTNCGANPATCTTAATATRVTITIGKAVYLALSPASTALTAPTPANYNAGFAASNGPTVTISANTPWSVTISSSSATWTGVDTGTEPAWKTKPAGDLRFSTAAGGPFTAMTTTGATIASGIKTAGTSATLFYRTMYSWTTDTPGNYSINVVFTITAP